MQKTNQVQWINYLPALAWNGPVPESQSLLDTRKYFDKKNISDSENILMDSSVYKTMNGLSAFYPQNSEREREKLGPVSFWLRPLFASSVIFCESVIAGVLSIQIHPDLLLVSSDHVTGMLRSHWSVLPSCLTLTVSINWANSTQK